MACSARLKFAIAGKASSPAEPDGCRSLFLYNCTGIKLDPNSFPCSVQIAKQEGKIHILNLFVCNITEYFSSNCSNENKSGR